MGFFPRKVVRIRMNSRNSLYNAPAKKVSNKFCIPLGAVKLVVFQVALSSLPPPHSPYVVVLCVRMSCYLFPFHLPLRLALPTEVIGLALLIFNPMRACTDGQSLSARCGMKTPGSWGESQTAHETTTATKLRLWNVPNQPPGAPRR